MGCAYCMNNITNKLSDFNIKEGTVIFDEKNNTAWFDRVAIGELYNIGEPRVSQIVKELKEDGLLLFSNTKKYKKSSTAPKTTIFHDIEAVKFIGVRTRSNIGIKLQNQLVKLSEGLRKGDLKIITTKSFLDFVDTENPTRNHLKNRKLWKQEGKTPNQLNQRSLAVFLTNGRNWYLSELDMASHNLCSAISDIFNKAITGHTAQELRKIRKIPIHRDIRDFFSQIESFAINDAESMFGLLVDKEKEDLTYEKLIELANIAAEHAHSKAVSTSWLLNKFYHDMTIQTDLFEVIEC